VIALWPSRPDPAAHGPGRSLAMLAVLVVAVLLGPPVAAAEVDEQGASALVPESGAYFGSSLDWSVDSAAEQSERLGRPSAVLEHVASLPISERDATYLTQFMRQAEGQGALGAITLRPVSDLADFDAAAATAAVNTLARAREGQSLPLYVRFAPDMNAEWVPWGQQPAEYVAAFRAFSAALHAGLPGAVSVWSPAAGESYPFAADTALDDARLDTNQNGQLDGGDDPYGPYYPGDDVVDWVGLSAYHDTSGGGAPVNSVPIDGELNADLDGPGDLGFYQRFAEAGQKPMMLETAAFFSPGAGGPGELEIKQAWWRQVLAATTESQHPLLNVVMWRDSSSSRAVVGEVVIDWSLTGSADVAAAFRSDVTDGPLVFGPLYTPFQSSTAAQSAGGTVSDATAWIVVIVAFLAAIILAVWGVARGRIGRFVYDGPANRDLRIDLLRGVAIVFVVVNHIALVSVLQNGTQEAIGMVSGAELFVLFSGAVLGLVYRPKVVSGGIGEVTLRTGRRAWKLYVTALVVVVLVGLVSLLPFIRSTPATTYVDQGTGAAGSEATGRVYDLYANFPNLLTYPADPSLFVDIALLRLGPWQVNVLGLYVVMLAVSPLILWALSRRRWILVLGISWAIYIVHAIVPIRLLPSQFEDSFPLLSWQALFVTGMVAGFYRREILGWFATRVGRITLAAVVVCTVALALFSWNNPYLSSAYDVRLGLVPANTFSSIYSVAFERTSLDFGRVINVFCVTITAYAALSVFWKPLHRLFGWFFIPLGQATLYAFIMHVLFVLIVANIPVLREGNIMINTLAYLVLLALLWLMVKTRFLFGIVPR
jgi:hypothetical protein